MADFRYELLKGVPFIKAHLEGKTLKFVGRFIIDTGSFMTIVRTPRIDAMGYSAFKINVANFEVAALDLPPRYYIDGLIGMNFLNQFDWCFHPQKLVISLK